MSQPSRHRLGIVAAALLVALATGASAWRFEAHRAEVPLYAGTAAIERPGRVVDVPDASNVLVPGTRVIADTAFTADLVREEQRWLAAGSIPSIPELGQSTIVRDALLDLHALAEPFGVPVAAWTPSWRYVWPRDSAYVASALARTGHLSDAVRIISFLQDVQPESGVFQARYLPDGSGVPDDRGSQTDGLGWALWGMLQVAEELPAAQRTRFVRQHRTLLDTSVRTSLDLIDNPPGLPPPSADYWEVKERKLTLSTAALLHAGLLAGVRLYEYDGDEDQADSVASRAAGMSEAITRSFAGDGFPRRQGGSAESVDLGVSFLLPPFTEQMNPEVLAAWSGSVEHMSRPAGGLSPGGSWRNDGISWTTSTSSYAATAAFAGKRADAVSRLAWLDAHRTRQGSLPEKVLYDGRPAAVAPLAWSAAALIIAVDELQR